METWSIRTRYGEKGSVMKVLRLIGLALLFGVLLVIASPVPYPPMSFGETIALAEINLLIWLAFYSTWLPSRDSARKVSSNLILMAAAGQLFNRNESELVFRYFRGGLAILSCVVLMIMMRITVEGGKES